MKNHILNTIIKEFVVEICFEYFQSKELARLNCSFCGRQCRNYHVKPGYDIYGNKIDNHDANGKLVECGICKKTLAASRFAPHLEKCMGLGRTSRKRRSGNKVISDTTNRTFNAPSSTSEYEDQFYGFSGTDEISSLLQTNNPKKKRKKSLSTTTTATATISNKPNDQGQAKSTESVVQELLKTPLNL